MSGKRVSQLNHASLALGLLAMSALGLDEQPTAHAQSPTISASDGFGSRTLPVAFQPTEGETPIEAVCGGAVSNAADAHFFYASGNRGLEISVHSEADIALLVATPDGHWRCMTTEGAVAPRLRFDMAQSGRYGIWVGAIGAVEQATIEIVERDPSASP